jgi:hypothetical protein
MRHHHYNMFKHYLDTLKETVNHPRNVVDGFLHSENRPFQHPFLFCVIGMALVIVLNTLLVDFSFEPQVPELDDDSEELREMAEWIQVSNVRASTQFLPFMMVFILIPMLSIPGLFFFREKIDGFFANLILNSYAVGASIIPLLAMIPVWILIDLPLTDPFMSTTLPAALVASIGIWVYKQYFQVSELLDWIRILSSFITGYVLFMVLSGFLSGVAGYMIFAVNRILELAGSA